MPIPAGPSIRASRAPGRFSCEMNSSSCGDLAIALEQRAALSPPSAPCPAAAASSARRPAERGDSSRRPRDLELAVRVREVDLDRLRRHVELLGDLAVRHAARGEIGYPLLGRRQRADAADRLAPRPRPVACNSVRARSAARSPRPPSPAPGLAATARAHRSAGGEAAGACRARTAPSPARASPASRSSTSTASRRCSMPASCCSVPITRSARPIGPGAPQARAISSSACASSMPSSAARAGREPRRRCCATGARRGCRGGRCARRRA